MQDFQLDFKEAENILKADINHMSICGQLPWPLGTSSKLDTRENSKQTKKMNNSKRWVARNTPGTPTPATTPIRFKRKDGQPKAH